MSMYGKYRPGEKAWPSTSFVGDPGRTVQSDRDEADINKIVARIQKTGQLPPMLKGQPFYGDVSEIGNLAECMEKVLEAENLFMTFPAEVRERFANDPVRMVDFLADETNREEAVKLGIVQAKVPEPKAEAPAAAAAAPVPAAPAGAK